MILMCLDCAVCVLQEVMDLPEGGLGGVNLGFIMCIYCDDGWPSG